MNVSLPRELEEYVRSHVETGNYDSASEVVQDALRSMQERDEEIIQELRQMLIEGEQSGVAEDFSFEKLNAEIDEMMVSERNRA